MAWFSLFLCFFGWFGIAPLIPIIRDELRLTKVQEGNTIIASVAIVAGVRRCACTYRRGVIFLTQDTPTGDCKDWPHGTRSNDNKAFAEALKTGAFGLSP
jgi:hypothetical protein